MRLIDAEAFEYYVNILYCSKCETIFENCHDTDCWIDKARRTLEALPTIEAKPIIHAHWEEVREGRHICSNCKVKASLTSDEYDYMEDLSDYCPRCGAQMDELVSKTDELNSSVKIPVMSMKDICRKIMCDR